jgi:hypothetical protein
MIFYMLIMSAFYRSMFYLFYGMQGFIYIYMHFYIYLPHSLTACFVGEPNLKISSFMGSFTVGGQRGGGVSQRVTSFLRHRAGLVSPGGTFYSLSGQARG